MIAEKSAPQRFLLLSTSLMIGCTSTEEHGKYFQSSAKQLKLWDRRSFKGVRSGVGLTIGRHNCPSCMCWPETNLNQSVGKEIYCVCVTLAVFDPRCLLLA